MNAGLKNAPGEHFRASPEGVRRLGCVEPVRCIAGAMDRMKPKFSGAWTSQRRVRRFQDTLFLGKSIDLNVCNAQKASRAAW